MPAFGFMNKNVDPETLYNRVKDLLEKQGFKITSEEAQDAHWDLHAKKSGLANIISGNARDVDLIVGGDSKTLSVQLHAGIWGSDFSIPGKHMFDPASAGHPSSSFEEGLWEEIVHMIDAALVVCRRCGRVFSSELQLEQHEDAHRKRVNDQINQFEMAQNWGWV